MGDSVFYKQNKLESSCERLETSSICFPYFEQTGAALVSNICAPGRFHRELMQMSR